MPYRYASVEGLVTAIEDTGTVEQRWELARRYLGPEDADGYIEATRDVTDRMCAIHITGVCTVPRWVRRQSGCCRRGPCESQPYRCR